MFYTVSYIDLGVDGRKHCWNSYYNYKDCYDILLDESKNNQFSILVMGTFSYNKYASV